MAPVSGFRMSEGVLKNKVRSLVIVFFGGADSGAFPEMGDDWGWRWRIYRSRPERRPAGFGQSAGVIRCWSQVRCGRRYGRLDFTGVISHKAVLGRH